jgi:hypothetical protein
MISMEAKNVRPNTDIRPRLIIWQLNHYSTEQHNGDHALTTAESLLTIESIARTAKPIVILTGPNLLVREDLFDIVSYGNALGLKIIIEAQPHELTDETLRTYSRFGARIFRIIVDGSIIEDSETRFKQTPDFQVLKDCINRMRAQGFEIHLSTLLRNRPSLRRLAFAHDFAVMHGARGLYCHLDGPDSDTPSSPSSTDANVDIVIDEFAEFKSFSPADMYVSPQCVRYELLRDGKRPNEVFLQKKGERTFSWRHECLGGKAFAFITPEGRVKICSNSPLVGGNLRSNGFNFRRCWNESPVFQLMREHQWSCLETRENLNHTSTVNRQTDPLTDSRS